MTATPRLLSPLTVRSMVLRNRVVSTAHGAFLDFYRPGESPDRYVAYQERRARGGTGLIILQPVHVHPSSHALGHHVYDPDDLRAKLRLLADRVHAHGTRVMIQLIHFGTEFVSDARRDLEPLWGFSPTVSPTGGEVAHEMTEAEIEAVVDGFARTAALAVEAGLDGVELHAAHGYLVQQSFSPWANQRTDRWGEPHRFVTTVLERIRAAVGDEPVVGIRVSLDDFVPPERGGVGPAGVRALAAELAGAGLVDLVNTSAGSRAAHYATAVASYHHPHGLLLPLARQLRAALGGTVPLVGVGRLVTPARAEQALADGDCDLVAMTRAQIADPDLVRKLEGAETTPVRPCVGANQGCVDRMQGGLPITCFHNPDVGREAWQGDLVPTTTPQHVVVVGGGPAGLKAAEVAARRGHRVTLVEAGPRLGGRLWLATTFGAAAELGGSLDWLVGELDRLGVEVRTDTRVDPAAVQALAPDVVVLATGSQPADTVVDHDGSVPIWTTDEAMTAAPPDATVLVVDHLGTHESAQAAERLAAGGATVRLVTPAPVVGGGLGFTHLRDQLQRFAAHGVRLEPSTRVVRVREGRASLRPLRGGEPEQAAVDLLVAAVPRVADDRLRAPLEAAGITVHVVGDAVAPRTAMLAFREGSDAGRAIA